MTLAREEGGYFSRYQLTILHNRSSRDACPIKIQRRYVEGRSNDDGAGKK